VLEQRTTCHLSPPDLHLRHGTAADYDGIDPGKALASANLGSYQPSDPSRCFRVHSLAGRCTFESTPVDYISGQPAVAYLTTALRAGKHAITSNKGPVVHACRELKALAAEHDVSFFFESAVMDGAPIFSLFRETLPAARLDSIQGVLNSTTNMILIVWNTATASTRQSHSARRSVSLKPIRGDIDGWDAAVKHAPY
jgi:homoserine dehydrogenase